MEGSKTLRELSRWSNRFFCQTRSRMDTVRPLGYDACVTFGKQRQAKAQKAFAAALMAHLDHLYRVAYHLVKDRDQANDFVQETYLRALGSYQQFSPGTNLKAWLTRILYNFFFDRYIKDKRIVLVNDKPQPADGGIDFWEKIATESPEPEQLTLRHELNGKINDALKKIPEEFRLPIVLVDMGDLSYVEAAEILSCPVGTIRSRLSRGRRLLHKHLEEYMGAVRK